MSFPCWYSLNASGFNHFLKFGNKPWCACARKVTSRYYLFALFGFWMRSTVNTFMLPLLPKGFFLLCFLHLCYTCSQPLAGFKCVLLSSWFLESKPGSPWPHVLQFSIRRSFAAGRAAEFVLCMKPGYAFEKAHHSQSVYSPCVANVLEALEKQ